MKASRQWPECKSCNKPISGEVNSVAVRGGGSHDFHKDPADCGSAPTAKELSMRPASAAVEREKDYNIEQDSPNNRFDNSSGRRR